jgi:hypothetical protein
VSNDPIDNFDPEGEQDANYGSIVPTNIFPSHHASQDKNRAIIPNVSGNAPVANPLARIRRQRCKNLGEIRNTTGMYDGGTCPCTGTPIKCFDFEQCEKYDTESMGLGGSKFDQGWVKHTRCNRCPEGGYGPAQN